MYAIDDLLPGQYSTRTPIVIDAMEDHATYA